VITDRVVISMCLHSKVAAIHSQNGFVTYDHKDLIISLHDKLARSPV